MVIGKLNVMLGLNNSKFNSGMEISAKKATTFGQRMKGMGGKLGAAAGKIKAAGAGFVQFAQHIKQAVQEQARLIDQLGKLSTELDVPIQKLRELQYAAESAGLSQEELSTAIKKGAQKVSQAMAGESGAVALFEELGLNVEKLHKMRPDEIYLQIGDALRKVENSADRTNLAMKVWEESGTKHLVNFENGMDGVIKKMEEFKDLNGETTEEMTADAAAYNDAQQKLATAWDGFYRTIANDLLPMMTTSLEKLASTVAWATGVLEEGLKFTNWVLGWEGKHGIGLRRKPKAPGDAAASNVNGSGGFMKHIVENFGKPLGIEDNVFQSNIKQIQNAIEGWRDKIADLQNKPTPTPYQVAAGGRYNMARIMAAEGLAFKRQDPLVKEQAETTKQIELLNGKIDRALKDIEMWRQREQRQNMEDRANIAQFP